MYSIVPVKNGYVLKVATVVNQKSSQKNKQKSSHRLWKTWKITTKQFYAWQVHGIKERPKKLWKNNSQGKISVPRKKEMYR